MLAIKKSQGKGRGVFAAKNFRKGKVIEVAPIIVLSFEDLVDTKWNKLFDYYFWMDEYVVLALGYGSLYNHSENPNASYKIDKEKEVIIFKALRDIKKGEEILFNYKGKEKSKTPLWFEREK
ncbi:SET domain-containing protein-lysine N-methyltransferase [Candidatus Daviesbacteria bacterium]|nr:SET domain-containing protein-lysine N-methyltransferase [Candidatus Daviesbacteria bacterium]